MDDLDHFIKRRGKRFAVRVKREQARRTFNRKAQAFYDRTGWVMFSRRFGAAQVAR